MYKTLILLSLLTSLAFISSCSSSTEEVEIEKEVIFEEPRRFTEDNSATSVDWNGTYKGTVPCDNCEGVEINLTLNSDLTYKLVTNYLGRNDALEQENTGSFTWDETGSIITLEKVAQGTTHYKVGENRIWQLDTNGKMNEGDLADHYVLTKR